MRLGERCVAEDRDRLVRVPCGVLVRPGVVGTVVTAEHADADVPVDEERDLDLERAKRSRTSETRASRGNVFGSTYMTSRTRGRSILGTGSLPSWET